MLSGDGVQRAFQSKILGLKVRQPSSLNLSNTRSIIGGQTEIIDMRKKSCPCGGLRKFKDTVSKGRTPDYGVRYVRKKLLLAFLR